jgi:tetratricopeptide (TPR) repeat protein
MRGTRQKQTRLSPRRRKMSSPRRVAGSRSSSRREAAHRVRTRPSRKTAPVVVQKPKDIEREAALKNFGTAVRYFQRRDYEKAAALFEKVAAGPVREMADRARVHLSFCERQRHHERRPKSAEGCYARGVAALNSRDFDQALEYLNKSDKMIPNQEYVHYALAAVYGLQGDPDNAFNHLEAAIRLRPQNRVQARHDEDFQTLAEDPRFARLLGADARRPLT